MSKHPAPDDPSDTRPATPTDSRPVLMRRRWWVTFTVLLAVAVAVVWWFRQPDADPPAEDPDASSEAGAGNDDGGAGEDGADGTLTVPDGFAVGDTEWGRDTSAAAQDRLDQALEVLSDRPAGADGGPEGGVYVVDGTSDPAEQLVAVVLASEALGTAPPAEIAAQTVEFNLGQEIVSDEVDGGGVACGYVPVLVAQDQQAQQWFCAAAYGDAVANLLLPLSVTDADAATEQATAFYEAARA
ncbi:hypothetical protein ACOACO_01775 [Nocardioides sp. CPCC 205120]|uniref:hypothetical protein n=1 Tax=Nocardioides sp. CPCC 205120 TaxID=3406462 RepID=UPI003B50217F